jgi:hypothetical protein
MATVREERAATTWQCVRDRRIVGALGALGAAESPRRPSRCTRPWPTMDGQGERDEASWAVDGYLPVANAMATLRGFPIVLVATNHEDASLPNVEAGGSVAEVRECQRHGRADRQLGRGESLPRELDQLASRRRRTSSRCARVSKHRRRRAGRDAPSSRRSRALGRSIIGRDIRTAGQGRAALTT